MKIFTILFISYFIFRASFAQDQDNLKYDLTQCILNDGSVSCNDLTNDLNSSYNEVNDGTEDFKLSIVIDLTNPDPNNTLTYLATIETKKGEKIEVSRTYNRSASDQYIINDFIASINDVIATTFNKSSEKDSHIYAEPTLTSQGSSQQSAKMTVLKLEGGLSYLKEKWRAEIGGGYGYNRAVQPQTATTDPYKMTNIGWGVGVGFFHSLGKKQHWGVGVGYLHEAADFKYSPEEDLPLGAAENSATKNLGTLGVEWVQHPFIKKASGNISVQLRYSPQQHQYLDPRTFTQRNDFYHLGNLKVIVEHHFNGTNLIKGSVSTFVDVSGKDYSGIVLDFSPSFTVLKRIVLAPTFILSYYNNEILSPANSRGTNFLQFTGATSENSLSYFWQMTIKYAIGNSAKNRQDRRWR